MDDKTALLSQLKIDRGPEPEPEAGHKLLPLIGLALILLVAAGIAVLWLKSSKGVAEVSTATARSAGTAAASVLDASGYVVARRAATVSSKVTGKVLEVRVEEGQRVEAGEILARIDDSNARAELALTEAQVDASRAALTQLQVQLAEAQRQLQRNRELIGRQLISQASLDTTQATVDQLQAQIESARRSITVSQRSAEVQQRLLDDTVIRAPFAGVITVKNAQPGEMISPLSAGGAGTRTGIGTLVDMDSLEIEVDVNESFINRVQAGQPVSARLNAYPDWNIPCKVVAVVPTADRSKATVKVRIGLESKDPRILPDMGARVAFLSEAPPAAEAPKGVLVPAAAVLDAGGKAAVFVVKDGRLERRAVSVGAPAGADLRIVAGLAAGETVALGELATLADGMKVAVRP